MLPKHLSLKPLRAAIKGAALSAPLALAPSSAQAILTPLGNEFIANQTVARGQDLGPTGQSVAVAADGHFAVVWRDSSGLDGSGSGVFVRLFNANGSAQTGEIQVNTTTAGNQDTPAIAMDNNGNFVVAWEGPDGDGDGVFARTFNAAGAPTSGEIAVNTTTASGQDDPSVAMDADGDFVVAWESYAQDGDYNGVFARTFSAAGAPTSAEIPVNTTVAESQQDPAVGMDADGNFVVAWESYSQGATDDNVVFRRFNANGTPASGEVIAPATVVEDQDDAFVAMGPNGNFIIGWENHPSGGNDNVLVRLYNAAGTPTSGDITVNSSDGRDHNDPSVALQTDGDFAVVWEVYSDGDYYGILARTFAASGTPTSSQIVVNQQTTGDQEEASVALNDDGDAVVVFESGNDGGLRPGGDGYDVIARQFTLGANEVPADNPLALLGLAAGAGLLGAGALRRRKKR